MKNGKWIKTSIYKSDNNKNFIWIENKCSDCEKSYNQKWITENHNCQSCTTIREQALKIKEQNEIIEQLRKEVEELEMNDIINGDYDDEEGLFIQQKFENNEYNYQVSVLRGKIEELEAKLEKFENKSDSENLKKQCLIEEISPPVYKKD